VIQFFKRDVNIQYSSFIDTPADFPAITICNLNPFDFSNQLTADFIANITWANSMNPTIDMSSSANSDYDSVSLVDDIGKVILASLIANIYNYTDEQRKQISYSMETMLISCNFNGNRCNSSDFDWFPTYEYGSCWTFNSIRNSAKISKKSSLSGAKNGLVLELYVGSQGDNMDSYTVSSGIHAIVHNNSILPIVKYVGIPLSIGEASTVGISRTFYQRIGPPYTECRKDVETVLTTDSQYFKDTINITKYSRLLCYEICFQNEIVEAKCGCWDPSVWRNTNNANDGTIKICSTTEQIECVSGARETLSNISIATTCDKYCPLECDSIFYETSVSSSNYPTEYYSGILSTNKAVTNLFSRVSVYEIKNTDVCLVFFLLFIITLNTKTNLISFKLKGNYNDTISSTCDYSSTWNYSSTCNYSSAYTT
jgi:hypothetical protein